MAHRTVIVGGGLAGLTAAVALADRGVAVTVLESRPRLGGRASSFVDRTTGTSIDNCQHVSLGCCTNFRHFCCTIGVDNFFRTERELFFIGRDNRVNRLSAGVLPAPYHLSGSFAKFSYLTVSDLYRIAVSLRALAKPITAASKSTFLEWLLKQRQSAQAIERFWTPVLVSALSESLDRMDVSSARKVFVDAFLSNREGWQVQVPTVALDVLYGERLLSWLSARGATVRIQAGVDRILVENGRASRVVLRDGETLDADHVIVAVPHWMVLELLPDEWRNHPDLKRIRELQSAPISSVHLWFDRPILFPEDSLKTGNGERAGAELPHAVLIDRLSQWVFNRSLLHSTGPARCERRSDLRGTTPQGDSFGYQVVISASRNVPEESQQTITSVVEELRQTFPECAKAVLVHSRMVTEHRAVFSVVPGADECRPHQQSPITNLQLAGDWTRTGWPATMEGAVRSGYLAAENVLRHLGRREALVQPDLPVSLLSRLTLGIRPCR